MSVTVCPPSTPVAAVAPQRQIWKPVENLLTGLGLTIALSLLAAYMPAASGQEAPPALKQQPPTIVAAATDQRTLPNGVYLFGQAKQANQVGAAYLVFEVNNRQVVGAAYMPSSSFDCFHGQLQANQLTVTVIDSYDQSSRPYTVNLQTQATVATVGSPIVSLAGLTGYQLIPTLSQNDAHMLATCQAKQPKTLASE